MTEIVTVEFTREEANALLVAAGFGSMDLEGSAATKLNEALSHRPDDSRAADELIARAFAALTDHELEDRLARVRAGSLLQEWMAT